MKISMLLMLLGCVLAGCAEVHGPQSATVATWAKEEGGVLHDGRAGRVARIGSALARKTQLRSLNFYVLKSSEVTAYSWASGEVFVTSGLVDVATDDEIAASLAHELGHLLSGGERVRAVSMHGSSGDTAEERADLIGCQLLRASGRRPDAMVATLLKVRSASRSADCRGRIEARIALLKREIAY